MYVYIYICTHIHIIIYDCIINIYIYIHISYTYTIYADRQIMIYHIHILSVYISVSQFYVFLGPLTIKTGFYNTLIYIEPGYMFLAKGQDAILLAFHYFHTTPL